MAKRRESRSFLRGAAIPAAIIAVAILVRFVFLAELMHSELGAVHSLDARFYDELARSLASGHKLPPGALTFNPLYPYSLAAVYRIFGPGDLAPRIAQALLGILTIAFIYIAGRRIVEGPRSGKPNAAVTAGAAAGMALLYAPFVLYEGMLLGTTIEIFLLASAFLLTLTVDQTLLGRRTALVGRRPVPVSMLALLLGACVGAGSLGRPNLFLLLAASLPLWIIGRARSRRRGIAAAAVFAAGVVLFLLPPIVYNARATRRFVPVTAHGGVNFYIGNRLGSLGVYSPPDDMRSDMRGLLEDAHFLAERETGRTLTDAEVSQYYLHRAFAEIRRDPAAWLRLLGKKLALFWNHIEVPDVPNVFFVQTSCPVLSFLFLPFAAIAPLAIGGFLALWRSGRNRGIAAIFLSAAVLSVILFFVNSRYRLPALPVLLVLAAFFIAWGAREASRRRFRPLLLVVAPACAVLLLATLRDFVRVNRSAAYSLLGNYYIDRGDETKAAEAFTEAYRLDPARAEAMVNYARVLMRANDFGAAAALYERAYALNPRIPRLALEYGTALERTGRREEAKRLYEEGVSAPRISERVIACRLLAQAALADGDRAEAIRWVRRAIEMAPGDSDLTGMLRWLETGGSQ